MESTSQICRVCQVHSAGRFWHFQFRFLAVLTECNLSLFYFYKKAVCKIYPKHDHFDSLYNGSGGNTTNCIQLLNFSQTPFTCSNNNQYLSITSLTIKVNLQFKNKSFNSRYLALFSLNPLITRLYRKLQY